MLTLIYDGLIICITDQQKNSIGYCKFDLQIGTKFFGITD